MRTVASENSLSFPFRKTLLFNDVYSIKPTESWKQEKIGNKRKLETTESWKQQKVGKQKRWIEKKEKGTKEKKKVK